MQFQKVSSPPKLLSGSFRRFWKANPKKQVPQGKSQPFAAARLPQPPPGVPPVHISVGAWPSKLRIRVRQRPHVQVEALMGRGVKFGWNYGAPINGPSINGDHWGLLLSYRSLCWILYPAVTLGPKPFRSQAVQGHLELLNNGEPPSFWKASGGKSFKINDYINRKKQISYLRKLSQPGNPNFGRCKTSS